MFGLDLIGGVVRRAFRERARSAAIEGTLEGIADALEKITGDRPAIPAADAIGSQEGRQGSVGGQGKDGDIILADPGDEDVFASTGNGTSNGNGKSASRANGRRRIPAATAAK